MYEFTVVAFFGLVALKVTDLAVQQFGGLDRIRTLVTLALGIAAAVALDYSIFAGFGITVREAWIGTIGTGLVIGSLASVWSSLLAGLDTRSGTRPGTMTGERPRIAA